MSDFDSPWKEALEAYFPLFMALFFPQAHADIDWSRGFEALDQELQQVARDAELGRRVVDKLFKVWLRSGQEEWLLVHVEVQSHEEADFARRMFVYHYRILDRYDREVVSLAVLADERAGWRPDHFFSGRWGCEIRFRFPLVKLLDWAKDVTVLEANLNPFAALVLAHIQTQETRHDPEQRRLRKVRLIRGLYERGLNAQDVRRLFRLIDWMMDLPPKLERQVWRELENLEKEKQMPYVTSVERIGFERGRTEGLLQAIKTLLDWKYGEAGSALFAEIQTLDDPEKLAAILKGIPTTNTPDELRRLWR
jgi:hypothetical protein